MSPGRERPISVLQYGLGPIGQETARTLFAKAGSMELVGAVDVDPVKVGRDLSALLEMPESTGVVVSGDPEQALADSEPEVVLHTTTSFLEDVYDQLERCMRAGAHVVSSAEELLYPFERHPDLAARLDAGAREHGVAIVGTGVNPGYAMDALPLMATGVCREVSSVRVRRVVDAAERRLPLQRKVGAGLSPEAFADGKTAGTLGHVGLRESLLLLARGMGWSLDRIEETLDPVLARRPVSTPHLSVNEGEVAGIHHAVTGHIGGRVALSLDLEMFVGAERPRDSVRVEGDPPVDLEIRGGIFGDTATVGALVNTAPVAAAAEPGLRVVTDLPLPRAFATSSARADLPDLGSKPRFSYD